MPFTEIKRERFDQLNQPNRCEGLWPREQEQAWFACDNENIVGVLLMNPNDQRWTYMLCVKAEHGGYRRVGVGSDIPGERLARKAIQGAMEGYRSCGPVPG
jgi:hypothetical protein